jgi:hypothetical protein
MSTATELWHPEWCDGKGPCGNHLSVPIFVPVTGDPPQFPLTSLTMPRMEFAAAITRNGSTGVSLGIYDYVSERWVSAIARTHEARWAADALLVQAKLAESS